MPDIEEHITFKKLKAARVAIQAFLPDLNGRRLFLHDNNQYVIGVLTHFASKSPAMMCELRKWFLLNDTYDIKIRTPYIWSDTNVWADSLSCVTSNSDWQLAPRKFKHFDKLWGPYTVDRFALNANKQMPRHNAKWRDSTAEAMDNLHLTDAE